MSTTAEESLDAVNTYTLEGIDDNLATLSNILKYSKHHNERLTLERVDYWLDQRLELTSGTQR